MSVLTSRQNPKFKQILKLREKKHRDQSNQFLIEGYREILRAVEANYPIETLFTCEDLFLGDQESKLIENFETDQVLKLHKDLFERASYRDRPDGLIAIAPIQKKKLTDLKLSKNALVVVCESIEKPGNLGSILRSSDAAGVDAVILCDKRTDMYNPNVVRASIGTLFTVPVVESSREEVLDFLKKNNLKTVATTPHTEQLYTKANLSENVAVLMGTEQLGLSDFWMKEADIQVKIPMYGLADSLNVAAATTLVLYEARRQMG